MNFSYYRISHLPDLVLNKYKTLSDTGVDGVLEQQEAFLRLWIRVCALYGLSLHLLVCYNPKKLAGIRLEIGLLLYGKQDCLEEADKLMRSSLLCQYYDSLHRDDDYIVAANAYKYPFGCTLIKRGRMLPRPIANDHERLSADEENKRSYHFVHEWKINEKCRLVDLYRNMSAIGAPCTYRVDIYPTDLSEITRKAFQPMIYALRRLIGYNSNVEHLNMGRQRFTQRNYDAEEALCQYEKWIETVETSPHARVQIVAFADTEVHAKLLLNSAGSEAITEGEYTLLPLNDIMFNPFGKLEYKPHNFHEERMPVQLDFWPTSFTCSEIAAFFRIPVLFEGEEIEIPKETQPQIASIGIHLGTDCIVPPHDIFFPIKNLEKHAFISGVPGSGKTNTMLQLATTLWKEHKIPFLVLEPAKKEYRALLNDHSMSDILLFSPCTGTLFPLAINPFEFPKGITLSEHIAALMQAFKGAYEINGGAYYYLDLSIQTAYENLGWKVDIVNTGKLQYPLLSEVRDIYIEKFSASGYEGEYGANAKEFVQVRLSGLMKRELDEVFNAPLSSLEPEAWLTQPAIIEMEAMPDEARNFLILLLCTLIREALRANTNYNAEKELRHILFIEEAHNLIAPQSEQVSPDVTDPKVTATGYIVKMLAEVRALHEGIVIADQIPSAMATEVLKNTGLKIAHRIAFGDDRSLIGSTMSASEMQIEALSTYNVGEALVFYEEMQIPFKIRIDRWKGAIYGEKGKSDNELYNEYIQTNPIFRKALETFICNGISKIAFDCASLKNAIEEDIPNKFQDIKTFVQIHMLLQDNKPLLEQKGNITDRVLDLMSQLQEVQKVMQALHNEIETYSLAINSRFGLRTPILNDFKQEMNELGKGLKEKSKNIYDFKDHLKKTGIWTI